MNELEELLQKSYDAKSAKEFIKALRSTVIHKSLSLPALIAILDRFCKDSLKEGRSMCAKEEPLNADDKKQLTFYGQTVAALMLLLLETKAFKQLREYVLIFFEYASALVKGDYNVIGMSTDILTYNFTTLGYGWSDIEDAISLDVLVYDIFNKSEMSYGQDFDYKGAGRVFVDDGKLQIRSSLGDEGYMKAFGVDKIGDEENVKVFSRNIREERLRFSDVDDVCRLKEFADIFVEKQKETARNKSFAIKREIEVGDKVTVKILGTVAENGHTVITCLALDSDELIKGTILNEELTNGVYTEDLVDYMFLSDCIENVDVIELGNAPKFSIKNAYSAFSEKSAHSDDRVNKVFEAKVLRIRNDINRIIWMTAGGYGAVSLMMDGVKEGDIKELTILNIQNDCQRRFVNVGIPKYGYETIIKKFDADNILFEFITSPEMAVENLRQNEAGNREATPCEELIKSLSRIIFCRTVPEDSLETYKRMLCARFLAIIAGDTEGAALISDRAAYLATCIEYAQKGHVTGHSLETLSDERQHILKMLSLASEPKSVTSLAMNFIPGDMSSKSNQIGALLIALGASDSHKDDIRTDSDTIRKSICKILEVEDQFRKKGSEFIGKYGNVEGHQLEFKSSYVMRNDGKGADIAYQGRGQVFEAVCGFLNSDGGIVYLGVDDNGEPIRTEDAGMNGDIRWLTDNYSSLNSKKSRLLGHSIPKADTPDHFVQFLNMEKELYFKESVRRNITIEVTEDQDAIQITVKPSQYEIAVLYNDNTWKKGTAYMRDGASTRQMEQEDKKQRLMALKNIKKEVGFMVVLQEAIDKHQKVILKNYSSGQSGTVRDRSVIPINLYNNDENVYCWDLDANKGKEFRLARMEDVVVDGDAPVPDTPLQPKSADVFRWVESDKKYHIKIRMEIGAYNCLIEEYSGAKYLPSNELYREDEGKWILDTTLYGLGAICRFYLGLADKIEILETEDSEALKARIKEYLSENFSGVSSR